VFRFNVVKGKQMKLLKQKILFFLYFRQAYVVPGSFNKDERYLSYNYLYSLISGFMEASVRKAVLELAASGAINKMVRSRKTLFRITVFGRKQVRRIFDNYFCQNRSSKGWFLAVIIGKDDVRKIRLDLEGLGFVCLKRGVYIKPAKKEFEISLEHLLGKAFFVFAKKLELADEKNLTSKLWHLDKYYGNYSKFVTRARGLLEKIEVKKELSFKEKKLVSALCDDFFVIISDTINLPKNLLPDDWPLPKAAQTVNELLKLV